MSQIERSYLIVPADGSEPIDSTVHVVARIATILRETASQFDGAASYRGCAVLSARHARRPLTVFVGPDAATGQLAVRIAVTDRTGAHRAWLAYPVVQLVSVLLSMRLVGGRGGLLVGLVAGLVAGFAVAYGLFLAGSRRPASAEGRAKAEPTLERFERLVREAMTDLGIEMRRGSVRFARLDSTGSESAALPESESRWSATIESAVHAVPH